MTLLTPGIIFLSRAFIYLLFPCLAIATLRIILDNHFGIVIPGRFVIGATVLAIPIITTIRLGWAQIKTRRRAAALDSRVAPTVTGKWLGNLDILKEIAKLAQHGYLGKRSSILILSSRSSEINS
jgi:hypothetical protein